MSVSPYAIIGWSMVAFAAVATVVLSITGYRRRVRQATEEMGGFAAPTFEKDRMKSISVPCATSLRFAIRLEDDRTRRMRNSDALVELQTGDFAFDAKFYLECDDTRVRDWLRRDGEARTLIASLVGLERAVELRTGGLALTSYNLYTAGGELKEHARCLRALADRVPVVAGVDPASAPQGIRVRSVLSISWTVLFAGLLAGVFALGDAYKLFPQHVTLLPLLLGAAFAGSVLATAAYLLALRALRSSSHAPRQATEFFVRIWIPIVAMTVIAAHQYNLKAIVGDEHVEIGESAGVYSKRERRGSSHYFVLRPLDNGRIPEAHYRSTEQLNDELPYGRRVRVYWREGPLASFILTRPPEPLPDAGD